MQRGRTTPVGSLFNYASMTYESSNIDKYGPERALARVSGDLFYGLTMVILGTTVGLVEVTVAGHALDYNYNSYKNKRFPPASKEEIIE